jgi:hypothetical protein
MVVEGALVAELDDHWDIPGMTWRAAVFAGPSWQDGHSR